MLRSTIAIVFCWSTSSACIAQTASSLTSSDWSNVEYFIYNESVDGFLETLERDLPVSIDATNGVKGRLRNLRLEGKLDEVLDVIAGQLACDWYLFNGVIHISAKSEAGTRVIRLGDLSAAQAMTALDESGIPASKFSVQVVGEGSAIAVSGPPSFLALSEAVIEAIPEAQQQSVAVPSQKTVVVRRGVEVQIVPIR